jgi:hypothetical protein
MKKWLKDPGEDLVQPENRYSITVEFTMVADSIDDAESDISEIIQEGILIILSEDDSKGSQILEYNITNVEPAEVY